MVESRLAVEMKQGRRVGPALHLWVGFQRGSPLPTCAGNKRCRHLDHFLSVEKGAQGPQRGVVLTSGSRICSTPAVTNLPLPLLPPARPLPASILQPAGSRDAAAASLCSFDLRPPLPFPPLLSSLQLCRALARIQGHWIIPGYDPSRAISAHGAPTSNRLNRAPRIEQSANGL